MKLLITILFLLPVYLMAQTEINISGKILDKNTGLPLQGASVFAQNTTFGVASRADGTFLLKLPPGGYDLVVTFTGYENASTRISNSNSGNSLIIELRPKEKALSEVSVTFSTEVKDGWQKYGTFFTDNFLGKTQFAAQSVIKNPEILKFYYSKKRNRLKVMAEEPLLIVNQALGYNIKYAIDSFAYEYATNTNTFVGYPLFEEMNGTPEQKAVWQQNRSKIYKGSILHFMRSMYSKTLAENNFEIQFVVDQGNNEVPVKLKDQYGAVNYSKDDSLNIVSFSPNQPTMAVIYDKAPPEPAYFSFDPNANKNFRVSTLTINPSASIFIERNGYFYEQSDIIINGYWGFEKVANMLPYDYVPVE